MDKKQGGNRPNQNNAGHKPTGQAPGSGNVTRSESTPANPNAPKNVGPKK
ncbi:hypothetical protein Bhyg_10409 [Pseudolycoriella hygida]|uniref:Uncharacterized protein n=1 Tax=Pseudolycoriella hygida TaxID=35572 RepID=A0A9Q0RZ75_9DIPT|nr:hypothetical protein Bhyg_10409 [Pseudolycoriella hygida]